jgi:hypothetical protein
VVRTRPVDAIGCGFLTGCAILVYAFGTLEVLPALIGDASLPFKLVTLFVCSYLLFGVLANIALIHYRNSSIANKIMPHPVIKPPPVSLCNGEETDATLKERTKYMGQHFLAKPFGEEVLLLSNIPFPLNVILTCLLQIRVGTSVQLVKSLYHLALGIVISVVLVFYEEIIIALWSWPALEKKITATLSACYFILLLDVLFQPL